MSSTHARETTRSYLAWDLRLTERTIAELRAEKDSILRRLEWSIRERDRLRRHLASLDREEARG